MPELERKTGVFVAAVAAALVAALAGMAWKHLNAPDAHKAGATTQPAPAGHAHHADALDAPRLELDDGRKWATDPPLRQVMESLRALVMALGPDVDAAQAASTADGIRGQVNYLIANCKLEPRADAVLHVLIGQLLAGAAALNDSSTRAEGIEALRQVLTSYPQYFEHPGWQ